MEMPFRGLTPVNIEVDAERAIPESHTFRVSVFAEENGLVDINNIPNAPKVFLDESESIIVKTGGMLACQNLDFRASMKANGILEYLGRLFAGNLVLNTFTAKEGGGWISFEQDQVGQIALCNLKRNEGIVITQSSFLACSENVDLEYNYVGFKGIYTGRGLVTISAKVNNEDEVGKVFFSTVKGFIQKFEITDDEPTIIDNNNIVAYTDNLQITVETLGDKFSTIVGGEGLVCKVQGKGTVYVGSCALWKS